MFKMPFNDCSTVSGFSFSTVYKDFRTKRVAIPTKMPVAEMRMGYIMAHHPSALKSGEEAANTKAAQEASAKEPKRSAPIPAMSPTLSPTLSVMHAGLR